MGGGRNHMAADENGVREGDCCMARHANATPPWTCDCPCHIRKETREFIELVLNEEDQDLLMEFLERQGYFGHEHEADVFAHRLYDMLAQLRNKRR
jgi:hypothetical protein